MENTKLNGLKGLYNIGGICAFLQIISTLVYSVLYGVLGPKPTSATEYFDIYQSSPVQAFFRGDFLLMVLIGLYLGTIPALYMALRHSSPIYAALAALFTILAVAGTFATESSFALLRLGEQYVNTTDEVVLAQLRATGEAVIASDMWNSSAGYTGGILLQGSGVMISIIMLRNRKFSKVTAYSGLLANGLDLIQHLLHLFLPAFSSFIIMFMGVFYFVWFPMLGRDLLRLAKECGKQ